MDELRIIKYLDGEMSGEEQKAFEDEVRMNPPLQEELEKYRQIQDLAERLLADRGEGSGTIMDVKDTDLAGVPGEPAEEVEKEIREAVAEFKSDPSSYGDITDEYRETVTRAGRAFFSGRQRSGSLKMIRRIWYSAAAVVILALTISILIFRPFEKMTPDEIYAEYFMPYRITEQIADLARDDNDFLFATRVYQAGDYERAAVLFGMLTDSSEVKTWSLFYEGCSYMALNQPEKAVGIFLKVLDEGNEKLLSPAKWQLALCYFKLGRPDEAREILLALRGDPEYHREAGKILRNLR